MAAVNDDSITVIDGDMKEKNIMTDNVILAVGMDSSTGLYYDALKTDIPEVYSLGDCREARNIAAAVWDGFEVARMV